MSEITVTAAAKIARLLGHLQERITRTADETRKNADAIATHRDEVRLKIGTLQQVVADKFSSTDNAIELLEHQSIIKIKEVSELNDKRESQQTLRDQNNVQSLVNLRDSVQKAFTAVRGDIESLVRTTQRFNERIGIVESQNVIAMKFLTTKPQPEIPTDHVWVNKKLGGVFNVIEELENRIKQLEAEIELTTNLRKAQAAFVLGPTKTPEVRVNNSGANEGRCTR